MPIADKKKVQTAINRVGRAILEMRGADQDISEVIALFQAANPSVIGTPLEGNVATLGSAITALRAELNGPIFDALIAAVVPSHRGRAL